MTSQQKETLWYQRAIKMIADPEHKGKIASWWLRLEYPDEAWTTSQINYWLKKSVDKGMLLCYPNYNYTQYSLPAQSLINPKNE